ncbi:MAG: hypothetical protein V1766_10935 [Pseudomonadota bacterium]
MMRDVAEKSQSAARSVKYHRTIAIAHHVFALSAGFASYLALLFGLVFADKHPKYATKIILTASVLSTIILVACTFLKRSSPFLNIINKAIYKTASNIANARQGNPFFIQLCLTLFLLYLPIGVLFIIAILSQAPWIVLNSPIQQIFIDSVKQTITFTAVILPVQVALFTFMFAQLLGKYSSGIVGSLSSSPIILLLWSYPIISLFLLNFACLYGYPETLNGVLAFFFASLNVICLVLTIWVANTGTLTDKVIAYAGNRFSQKVRRRSKRALLEPTRSNRIWILLNYFGLDWRDADRMTLFYPPSKSVAVTYPVLASLFNVANKALAEGQQEVFVSALIGIRKVLAAYIDKRASYFGTTDSVISYAVDQMAALLSASSKSSNEYLITEVVRFSGDCAVLSLLIDVIPKKKEPSLKERMIHWNHPLTNSWMVLLGEAFQLSHTLMRSTAANETITQLVRIVLFAFQKEYGDVVFVGYLPKIREIHGICVARNDAYHLTLAGDCIAKTMSLWSVVTRRYGQWSCKENLNKEMANTIFQMAFTQFAIEKLPSFNFKDAKTVLFAKLEQNVPIIQDIFIITAERGFSEWWEEREIVNDLRIVITLVVNVAQAAIKNKIAGADSIIEAFYEISYLILRGLPEQYKKVETNYNEDEQFTRSKPSAQEILEKEIFDAWSLLFPIYFCAEDHIGIDWEQNFFGIIGIAVVCYTDQKRDSLKTSIIRLVEEYFALCLKEEAKREHGIRESRWNYLQLLGAWVRYFLNEDEFARNIAKVVAEKRRFHYSPMSIGSSHGRYGRYGYPEASLSSDFFLPWLRNLQPQEYLTEQEWDIFRQWQKTIMSKEVLIPFYNIVEETRKPLREAFHMKIREYEKEKKMK